MTKDSGRWRPKTMPLVAAMLIAAGYIVIIAAEVRGLSGPVGVPILGAALVALFVGVLLLGIERRRRFRDRVRRLEVLSRLKPQISAERPPLSLFRGRARELEFLENLHAAARTARDSSDRMRSEQGPVVIVIHGMAGVGKSVVARELARRLGGEYTNQLYTNLGRAGDSRPPLQVVRSLLGQIPTVNRAMAEQLDDSSALKIFRSATSHSRYIIALDAARDSDQVRLALPSGSGNFVIVTSRRDLGPPLGVRSYHLDLPSFEDAFAVWHAASRTSDTSELETTHQILVMCGRLPIAIRSAAEAVDGGMTVADLANRLRDPARRLNWLSAGSIQVEDRISSEYHRLTAEEQRALKLVAITDSETLVPWVLTAMDRSISLADADALMAGLGAAHLLDSVARDEASGLDRYSIHPLVRIFGRQELISEVGVEEARSLKRHWIDAYLNVASRILSALDLDYIGDDMERGVVLLPGSVLSKRIASIPNQWVRADVKTLVEAIMRAFELGRYELCWRIAVRMGGTVARPADFDELSMAFDRAQAAVEMLRDRISPGALELARTDVQLSRGRFLVAAGRLTEAHTVTSLAVVRANRLRTSTAARVRYVDGCR